MKLNDQEKTRSILVNIKNEVISLKKDKKQNRATFYPTSLKERIKSLLIQGISDNLVHQMTGIPLTTIYSWHHVKKKKKKPLKVVNVCGTGESPKGFQNLTIVEDTKPVINCKSNGEILVTLANDIKLIVPLDLMGPMIKLLKEQWHVSRI